MKLAPITIFVYSRPWHIRQTVKALKKNKLASQSRLYIFSDGPKDKKDLKKVEDVRKYLKTIKGFKNITVTERKENLGLAESIITGVTEIINRYGRIIVLEDDLLTSPYFLKFMNDGLNLYEKEEKVSCIHGYVYPVKNKPPEPFFLRDPGCLGWATWKRGWELFEHDGKKLFMELNNKNLTSKFDYNNSYPFTDLLKNQLNGRVGSWAIRWYASLFLKKKLTLYPRRSLVFHNGGDGSGTHGGVPDDDEVKLSNEPIDITNIPIEENCDVTKEYIKYFKSIQPCFVLRVGKKVLRGLSSLLNYKK